MNGKDLVAAVIGLVAHGFAWISATEQIWMPTMGAYVRYIAPGLGLPDLRGPFLFITMLYIGLRFGDLWDERDEIEETL
jgi:sterol desaturase/sphingolipid hydroxylase (fatty acid hydroxylase superfamily)